MLKKILPFFLFIAVVFIFNPNNANSAEEECPAEGGAAGTVICGPDHNGSFAWANEKKDIENLTIFKTTFGIRQKSVVNMGRNSTLTINGGGCLNNCDEAYPSSRTYGNTLVEIDDSSLFQSGGLNSKVLLKDVNRIRVVNNSRVTLGRIEEKELGGQYDGSRLTCPGGAEGGCYTDFAILVQNSNASIAGIDLANPLSVIRAIEIKNKEENRGNHDFTLIDGIKAFSILAIELEHADATIGGDIVAYGNDRDGKGAISRITLDSSDLVLRGERLSQLQILRLENGSVFKVDPTTGRHLMELGSGTPLINIRTGSELIAQDIKSNLEEFNFILADEDTKFSADKIYLDKGLMHFSDLNFDVRSGANFKLKTLDTQLDCGINCSSINQNITLRGDDKSRYEIGEVLINSENVRFIFENAYGKIDKIEYRDGGKIQINGTRTDDQGMHIGTIDVLAQKDTYDIDFTNQNIRVDNINLKQTNKLTFNLNNSIVNSGNITCIDGCIDNTFNGIGGDVVLNLRNFNAGITGSETGASNLFNNITMNVSGDYNSGGSFNATKSNLNFGSMNGIYDSIVLEESSLVINKNSDITLSNGAVIIDDKSSLTIKGEDVFENPDDVYITNAGFLSIEKGSDFNILQNNVGAIAKLDGNVNINEVGNKGELELYNGVIIQDLNNEGKLLVGGGSRIERYDHTADSELNFYVATKNSQPTLTIGKMVKAIYEGDLSVNFDNLSVIRPGLKNRYDLIKTEMGDIGIEEDKWEEMFKILPPWLVYEQGMETSGRGQIAWVEIQRLTNYSAMMGVVPGYKDDKSILNLAGVLDSSVFGAQATRGLEDVVNSLDLNSGCGSADDIETQRILYLIHQGRTDLIDQLPNGSCLYTLAENINKLKPVSNEVYALYSHTNTVKSLDTILEANREYIYSNEVYSWYKGDIGYTSLADKDRDAGFNSVNSMFYVGATVAPSRNYNFSGMLGFGAGSLNGSRDLYDGTTNTITAGLAGTYLNGSYFVSLSGVVGLTNFETNRHVDFLDNEYSDNRETASKANLSVLELALKVEVGDEYMINSNTFLTPKVFASQSVLNNSGYEEFGSSAALNVDANTMLISDVGVGIELRRELLLPRFLGIEKAFWYPKIGVNVVERIYQNPNTEMKFVGTRDDFYAELESANYSGVLGQLYGSLLYQSQAVAVQVGYNGDASISGYMNHSINAMLKYSFQ